MTVVLNTIDDALDRSDPAGTVWTADAIKHLEPILARAATAGRTDVITADHGHVVERRESTQKAHPEISSARSREVTGPRVLTQGHRVVLAVDDGLRYGPLKAGYHGGASAAEVVVPVAVLVPDQSTNPAELALLPPQVPAWWINVFAGDDQAEVCNGAGSWFGPGWPARVTGTPPADLIPDIVRWQQHDGPAGTRHRRRRGTPWVGTRERR